VRQLGLDLHEVARAAAAVPPVESYVRPVPVRMEGQTPPGPLDLPRHTLEQHLRHLFHDVWNRRRLDALAEHYAPGAVLHTAGARVAVGPRAIRAAHVALMASIPDGRLGVGHVSWADETDGIVAAVRWEVTGTSRTGGWFGPLPPGLPVRILGMTHCRFDDAGRIAEEWTVFDEVAVLAQAYRATL
jgi:predicted ester cyclase